MMRCPRCMRCGEEFPVGTYEGMRYGNGHAEGCRYQGTPYKIAVRSYFEIGSSDDRVAVDEWLKQYPDNNPAEIFIPEPRWFPDSNRTPAVFTPSLMAFDSNGKRLHDQPIRVVRADGTTATVEPCPWYQRVWIKIRNRVDSLLGL